MRIRSVSTGIDRLFYLFPGYCSEIPVERSVLHRLCDMTGCDMLFSLEISNRSRHPENPVVGAGRKTERIDRPLQDFFALLVQCTVLPDGARCEMSIAV